ncbi:NlpC/P60 family protein [Amycolatopsis acidicola]|uniref:NlpC/P60 family protein n=2 Tax=Amycolatopsis acidicola TaxID=2596893 RepID=A0A5N0VDB9_9PSEU|nr:NlpC/P60 family protein [Amycolatopsis acidicola]
MIAIPITAVGIAVVAATSTSIVELSDCATGGPGGGSVIVDQQTLDADAMDIARTVVDVVQQRHLPRRAAVLAVTTGLVESGLRNLDHGDRDSLGVFQQRPSQGWGTPAQILNPVYATNAFLDRLLTVDGWDRLPPGQAEQAVQRSGYPGRYAPRETAAADIVSKFWTGPDNPPPPTNGGDTATLAASVEHATTGCGDMGGSDIPRDPTQKTPGLPPDYTLPTDPQQAAAVSFALAQQGKPYVWGAKGPDSYDCSGLVLAAWAAAGVGIPAGTLAQVHAGNAVPDLNQLQPGDLLFIPGSLGTPQNPRHVGLYLGHDLIIDASDSSTGVILEPLTAWANDIVAIRRVGASQGSGDPRA